MGELIDRITFRACLFAVVLYIGTIIYMMFIAVAKERNSVKYDCRLAEISVDYPAQVKDECRRLKEKNHARED